MRPTCRRRYVHEEVAGTALSHIAGYAARSRPSQYATSVIPVPPVFGACYGPFLSIRIPHEVRETGSLRSLRVRAARFSS